MSKSSVRKNSLGLPTASILEVRQRWLELFDLSYATRRVTHQQIEPGVHAVVIPPFYREEKKKELLEEDVRAARRQVPELARGVRLSMDSVEDFNLALEGDYRKWMGNYGPDVAAGHASVTVFIDLAYLEAALLDRLWTSEVLVDFKSPLAFFRRGALLDYANVLEAVAAMVFEGRSLAHAADRLAREVLTRLRLYADFFLKLSALYADCSWRIEHDRFVMELESPGKSVSLALSYWELRGRPEAAQQVLANWRERLETLLREVAPYVLREFPKSFAA